LQDRADFVHQLLAILHGLVHVVFEIELQQIALLMEDSRKAGVGAPVFHWAVFSNGDRPLEDVFNALVVLQYLLNAGNSVQNYLVQLGVR